MLRVRWLGRARYRDALALQQGLFARSTDDHLLLVEHPHVFTTGVRADPADILVAPASVGADLEVADRGGAVTYHGPGQLTGYPILSLPAKHRGSAAGQVTGQVTGMVDTVAYVRAVEQVVIDALGDLGLPGPGRVRGRPGVWVEPESARPRKIAAVGVKIRRGRTMHGFALNVDPDLAWFDRIVPCGIRDLAVTSLAAEGRAVAMADVVDAVVARAVARWGSAGWDRQDVSPSPHSPHSQTAYVRPASGTELRELAGGGGGEGESGGGGARPVTAGKAGAPLEITERKPAWLRAPARMGPDYLRLKHTMRDLALVTVCEEAGCPNIYECWADGTATFMINGRRCTRACGFCLIDTRRPGPLDRLEPQRVADAVQRMGLDYAVITAVARDDLPDGGAGAFVATIEAVRRHRPGARVEVLIPDCKGDPAALGAIFAARPDVLNHNLETVARLQRSVRPSASYARSLAVLARAKAAGLVTKSSVMVGLGETEAEVTATLADLRAVGVDIVTLGQYLRPSAAHLPVARWWTPGEFERLRSVGEGLGIAHVEAGPLTRSSYHARQAAAAAGASAALGHGTHVRVG